MEMNRSFISQIKHSFKEIDLANTNEINIYQFTGVLKNLKPNLEKNTIIEIFRSYTNNNEKETVNIDELAQRIFFDEKLWECFDKSIFIPKINDFF